MDKKDKKEGKVLGENFTKMFDDVSSFIQELVKANEKLRFNLASMESEIRELKDKKDDDILSAEEEIAIKKLTQEKKSLENELTNLRSRLADVEKENKYFAEKYVEIERQNSSFASLYVASYQLHSTLDINQVMRFINEIVINLIGTEEFGLYMHDERAGELMLVSGEGIAERMGEKIKVGQGVIGQVAQTRRNHVSEYIPAEKEGIDPVACIPLVVEDQLVGVLAIFKLLTQKDGFEPIDIELFELLAGHAATSIMSARIYAQNKRKLDTLEGFMDLLNPAASLLANK